MKQELRDHGGQWKVTEVEEYNPQNIPTVKITGLASDVATCHIIPTEYICSCGNVCYKEFMVVHLMRFHHLKENHARLMLRDAEVATESLYLKGWKEWA